MDSPRFLVLFFTLVWIFNDIMVLLLVLMFINLRFCACCYKLLMLFDSAS